MVVNIYASDTGYFQSTPVFTGTTGPEITNPRRFAAQFWNERRINDYRLTTTFKVFPDNGFIEGKPVKAVVLKIVIVNLYKEYSYLRLNELKELSCFWVMIWQPSQLLWSALLYLLITLYIQK